MCNTPLPWPRRWAERRRRSISLYTHEGETRRRAATASGVRVGSSSGLWFMGFIGLDTLRCLFRVGRQVGFCSALTLQKNPHVWHRCPYSVGSISPCPFGHIPVRTLKSRSAKARASSFVPPRTINWLGSFRSTIFNASVYAQPICLFLIHPLAHGVQLPGELTAEYGCPASLPPTLH